MHRRLLLVLALAVLASAVTAAPEVGVGAARSNRLRPALPLLTYVASDGAVCLIHTDGSDPVRLTTRWKGARGDAWLNGGRGLAWSPSGRYLAFSRPFGHDENGDPVIKISVADTRGHIRWRFGEGTFNASPLWSPDGRHIAYQMTFGLGVARPNGSEDRVVASGGRNYAPKLGAWTSDGQRLAFDDSPSVNTPSGIFTVRPDGSDRRLLVADAITPAFSPDGSKLAYVSFQHTTGSQRGLFVAAADGSNPRLVAPQTGQLAWGRPAWSPDGQHLAFAQDTLLNGGVTRHDLVVARADGSDQRVLAPVDAPAWMTYPVWSPGGKLIAFARYPSGALVVVGAEGGHRRTVVARSIGVPAWRPAVALPAANRPRCHKR